jgi:hypothetical protein
MANTSALCRQQEAHHRAIAADATLPNVRRIALAAATAWAREAEEASEREQGSKPALSDEDTEIAREFRLEALLDDPDGSEDEPAT